MRKVLLLIIFATIGIMTTSNVMAAAVATSAEEATTIYDGESLKLLSKSMYIVEIDADGNQVEETGLTAEIESFITIGDEAVTFKMGNDENETSFSFKILASAEAKEDEEGTKSMVMSCLDEEEGDKVKVVLIHKANGDIAVTVHSEGMGLAFMNISVIETLLAANCEAL